MKVNDFILKTLDFFGKKFNAEQIEGWTDALIKYEGEVLTSVYTIVQMKSKYFPSLSEVLDYCKQEHINIQAAKDNDFWKSDAKKEKCPVCNDNGIVYVMKENYISEQLSTFSPVVSACACIKGQKINAKSKMALVTDIHKEFLDEGAFVKCKDYVYAVWIENYKVKKYQAFREFAYEDSLKKYGRK